MKQVIKTEFKSLRQSEIKALTVETKETYLTEKQFKTFSVVDLWSIQKNRKIVTLKKHMLA